MYLNCSPSKVLVEMDLLVSYRLYRLHNFKRLGSYKGLTDIDGFISEVKIMQFVRVREKFIVPPLLIERIKGKKGLM